MNGDDTRMMTLGRLLRTNKLAQIAELVAVFVVALAAIAIATPFVGENPPMLVLALIAVYVVSSMGEEIIYRGFLINRLAELGSGGRAALRFAVVASAAVFGLVHFDWGVMGIVQTGFMGLALGVSYVLVRRNLWVLILAHAYMDTLLLVQQYLPVK